MLKKLTFSILVVLLAVSLSFAGEYQIKSAKKINPSSDVTTGSSQLPAKDFNKVTASQLGFTDYDYAGNSTVNEQVWPYDIDGDGVLDPVCVWMQRFNTSEDGTRRVVMSVGLEGEFATFDVSDRTKYTGWGVVQSITAGPWAGNAAVMMHEGGEAKLTLVDLTTITPTQFHVDMNLDDNYPAFAYLDDGTIYATITATIYSGSADDINGFVSTGVEMPAGPSELPIRRSPNGQYLATATDTYENGDEIILYYSNDAGATWTSEVIGTNLVDEVTNRPGVFPLFANFGQRSLAVSNDGVVHVGMNGYALKIAGEDTTNAFPALYWNSRDKDWIAVSDEAEEGAELIDYYPGNGIGNSYPTPVVSEDGSVVAVFYVAPEYDGGTLQLYPGDGGSTSTETYYTDVKYAVSADGGVTFGAPEVAAGTPQAQETFPAVYDYLIDEGDDNWTAHFMFFTDVIPGVSLFDENSESEESFWSYETVTFSATPTTSVNDNEELATTFSLEQNYPNPFNPSTTIKYSVPQVSEVSLKVYDVLGKEVATLVDAQQAQGTYQVNFDASNLASGMYIYTIKAGSFVSSKKMLLMK